VVLSDTELREAIGAGELVFEPPLSQTRIQSASIDLALHNVFYRPRLPSGPGITVTVEPDQAESYQYMDMVEADSLLLKHGDFALGETAEAMTIPPGLCGWVEGKSGRARHGLIVHCTAPHIAPGWGTAAAVAPQAGLVPSPKRITLEFVNHGPADLELKAGQPIAQLIVMRVSSPSEIPYSGKHHERGT